MPSRVIAFALLALCGFASVARADVSLTDQQTFASGAGIGAPLAAGQVPRLIDATGLEWFINDEVTYATTSSSVGAASDAVFVGAVEATTAAGGTELSVLADAFDGFNALRVSVGGSTQVAYNQLGSATSDCNGRQIIMPVLTTGGVTVQRKVYVPADDGFARWLNIVSNSSGSDKSVTLTILNNLGSDTGTLIGTTSSGDAVASTADDWITSYEAFTQGSSPSPRLAHVLSSPGASIKPSAVTFTNGNDTPTWAYNFTVPNGGTVVIMNFAAGLASRSDAALKAAQLAALPPTARVCMTTTEQSSLRNMLPGIIPTGPEPTGPGGLTITSPTAAASYSASSPFVSIGGTAGPSRLTSVKWASNRGFSGTAQGTAEWMIPLAALLPGANVFTVTGIYSGGLPSISDTITINLAGTTYQLPEGATGAFFSTDLLIANPTDAEVEADVRFLKEDGTTVAMPIQTLAPRSRTTIAVDNVPGLESASGVSSIVSSATGAPLVVERTMFWDDTSYGSHGAAAIEGARTRFLFGEGSQGFFNTFLLLANSNSTEAKATVRFLPEGGTYVTKEYTLPPTSRMNVFAGAVPELVDTSFSFTVDSDLPIVAERAMYFGDPPLFNGGHDSPGVSLPALNWFFAEGSTGFFDTFFLLGNAGTRTANVSMNYQLISGGTIAVNRTVPPFGRVTFNAATENAALVNTSFALAITSDEPIIAERSMYWGRTATTTWYEGHNAFGVNEAAKKWGLAEGRVGTPRGFQTFILIGNATDEPSTVRVTFLRVGGGTVVKEYPIAENSRFNLDVRSMVPELVDEEFGAIVEVIDGSPVIVERSLYSSSGGVPLAAGTVTQAVRLP